MKNALVFLCATIVTVFSISGARAERNLAGDINLQYTHSFDLMMANISRTDAARGSVMAAPSHDNPNYYYHWVRDAALVMSSLVEIYADRSISIAQSRDQIEQIIKDYVNFSRGNQVTPNRSGGLGEPKFMPDGSAFNGEWGRPQNDGPALRATTLTHFANLLLDKGEQAYVRSVLYDGKIPTMSVIKADLEYTAHHWQDPCFDLWEESYGYHFYNRIVSRRALLDGAKLADRLGDGGAATFYREQAQNVENSMAAFWDNSRKILVVTRDEMNQPRAHKGGLDVAIILGALHGAGEDGAFAVTDDRLISTAYAVMQSFIAIYDINHNTDLGPAIGRYPEDVYGGSNFNEGNPWFLATLAYAEFCYRLQVAYGHQGQLVVTALNRDFLNYALHGQTSVQAGQKIVRGDVKFSQILAGLNQSGDLFMMTVLLHKADDGSISEQFSRHNGFMTSAPNLSWSHAAFLTATHWRNAH